MILSIRSCLKYFFQDSVTWSHFPGTCIPRDFGTGSVVCVDSLSHCDLPGSLTAPPAGSILTVTSSKQGQRWQEREIKWNSKMSEKILLCALSITWVPTDEIQFECNWWLLYRIFIRSTLCCMRGQGATLDKNFDFKIQKGSWNKFPMRAASVSR